MSTDHPNIASAPFGQLPDGTPARLFTLTRDSLRVAISDYGGLIVSIWTPDRDGKVADVALGYDTIEGYRGGKSYFGALTGRTCNRIARGRFTLDGVEYRLPINDGLNSLHGGIIGFDRVPWKAEPGQTGDGPHLKLTRTSPDGEEHYPGNLQVECTYSLTGDGGLRIDYHAVTDKATPINLTNHSYFNLAGESAGSILNHEVTLFADRFTVSDAEFIPTGEIRSVAGTALDFREPHLIGERINSTEEPIRFGLGYDHNFILREEGEGLRLAARVREAGSGRRMEVLTTEPAVHLYSGNFLDGTEIGKGGHIYQHRDGLCFETQHYPDAPNHPNFPSIILRPGEVFRSSTVYRFAAE